MEQRVVLKNDTQCIFFIQEANLNFYMMIPNAKKVSVVLGLFEDVHDDVVKKIPFFSGKVIVVPVIEKNVLDGVKEKQESYWQYLDKVLSLLINTAYKILTFNHMEVSNKIVLDNNVDYLDFNHWFVSRYSGRVELSNLNLVSSFSKPLFEQTDIPPSNVMEVPVEKETLSLDQDIESVKNKGREPGFVSYVLLGVLVAVISLVVLYLLI